jgi:hypothetical protein
MIFGKWDERAAYSRQAVPVSGPIPSAPVTIAGPGSGGVQSPAAVESKQTQQ